MGESRSATVFSERLRQVRELRRLTQAELATRARLQPAAVSHFETGGRRPSFDNLRRLADALEVSADYLIGRVDSLDAAPTADVAFRDYSKLNDGDRKTIQGLVGQMAAREASRIASTLEPEAKDAPDKGGRRGGTRP